MTDGEQRAALAVVRSLGRAGHQVHVVSARRNSLAGASRYARTRSWLPDPLEAPEEFAAAVAALVRRHGIEVVLPITDASLFALGARREGLAPALLPVPDCDRLRAVADKELVTREAARHGIAVPRQVVARCRSDVEAAAGTAVRYPLVLKPGRSLVSGADGSVKLGVGLVNDPHELPDALAALASAAYPLLLQERIAGPGIGVFLLLWGGSVRAAFMHRRLREKPPAGGVSVYRESIPLDDDLVRRSRALLEGFQWEGVAMVEYKVDSRTGVPHLMEINGRFWGSLQLAVDCGVDFPRWLVELARGRDPGVAPPYRVGLRSRWRWGDVDHLLARIRLSPQELALPPDAPALGRVLLDVLVPWRPGDRDEILRWSDPVPFLRETIDWFRRG
ncbi:MAG TPA: ATP-grasp domain-containing protein [Gemmatimonadales bacterium]|nr:ATP-grasp domain-containing protein [Gemmatimonadales bacterium]